MTVIAQTWCCISKGVLTMYNELLQVSKIRFCFDKNAYFSGETAKLWVEIDNSECDIPVDKINAKFMNVTTVRSDQGDSHTFNQSYAV